MRDPIWGVPREEVEDRPSTEKFMTTNKYFLDASAWKGQRPAQMASASRERRGRHHVDPRRAGAEAGAAAALERSKRF